VFGFQDREPRPSRLADQLAHREARWLYRRVETRLFRRHGLVERGRRCVVVRCMSEGESRMLESASDAKVGSSNIRLIRFVAVEATIILILIE
jgi:hypothetical protein